MMYQANLDKAGDTPLKHTNQLRATLLASLAVGALGACGVDATDVPSDANNTDAAPLADSAGTVLPLENYEVAGKVLDYFAVPEIAVAGAAVVTEGVNPAISATIDGDGVYSMEVLANSLFYLTSSATGYVASRSGALQMLASAIVRDQYIASTEGVARQYTSVGVAQEAGKGIVMVDLRDGDSLPIVGLAAASLSLGTIEEPGTSVSTPFFVEAAGSDLSPSAATPVSALDNYTIEGAPKELDFRRARAGFLNVDPGEYNVTVTLPAGGTQTIFVIVPDDGVSFVTSNLNGDGRGDPTIVLDAESALGYTEDIHPILQTVARGGDGCATCHVADFFLPFVGDAEATLALLQMDALSPAGTPRIDLSDPVASPLLQNPVYEDVPNHPNVFWTINSNHYRGILAWIEQGAPLLRADAVLP
ncbi:MAG: hypothetical protein GY811_07875 [Myxococcales bacterium]|nr:hypothetical protein [Myxococcales bacterium]